MVSMQDAVHGEKQQSTTAVATAAAAAAAAAHVCMLCALGQ